MAKIGSFFLKRGIKIHMKPLNSFAVRQLVRQQFGENPTNTAGYKGGHPSMSPFHRGEPGHKHQTFLSGHREWPRQRETQRFCHCNTCAWLNGWKNAVNSEMLEEKGRI